MPGRIAALILALTLASAASAQTLVDFEKGLDGVRKSMSAGKWQTASKKLDKLLAANEGQAYVLGRKTEVFEVIEAISFGLAHPDPAPSDFVEGNVRSYNERSGDIKIEWKGGFGKDWQRSRGGGSPFRYFVAPMTGPFSVDYSGKKLGSAVSFLLSVDKKNYYAVNSGERDKFRLMARREIDGKEEVIRDRNDSPVDGGEPYKFRLKVGKTSMAVTYNGKKLASIPKKKEHWGYLGIGGGVPDKLSLKGKIDTSWIQNRRSEWREETRRVFKKSFDIKQVAPAWLFEAPRNVASKTSSGPTLPWAVEDGQDDLVKALTDRLDDDRVDAASRLLEGKDGKALPADARGWFLARIAFAKKDYPQALERLGTLDREHVAVRVLTARTLVRAGRDAEAVKLVEDVLESFPDRRDDFEALAWDLFDGGRIEHANTVLERARGLGARGRRLDELGKLLRYASDGPTWPRRFEVKTRNYHVFSDIDKATCAQACDILEKAYSAFTAYVGDVEETGRRRFRVYLFSGEAGYASYVRDLTGTIAAGSAGLYFPKLKQLLVWNTDADQMLWTIRHEGFHQYFDRVCADDSPRWLNEGLAEYYERAKSGTWQRGTPREDHLDTLKAHGFVPLKRFVSLGAAAFMMDARRHYAQSWALVRFLRHSTRENRALFKALVDELKTTPPKAAMDEVFAGLDWEQLERDFKEHVASLR